MEAPFANHNEGTYNCMLQLFVNTLFSKQYIYQYICEKRAPCMIFKLIIWRCYHALPAYCLMKWNAESYSIALVSLVMKILLHFNIGGFSCHTNDNSFTFAKNYEDQCHVTCVTEESPNSEFKKGSKPQTAYVQKAMNA